MEDGGTGYMELLMARSDKGGEEIRRGMRCLSKKQEQDDCASRKTHAK